MPRLSDDGSALTLDLHGSRVDDAERLILRAARVAAAHGRSRLTVIHGSSTSSALHRNRTIRHALYDLLDDGRLDAFVTDDVRLGDTTMLSLSPLGTRDPRRLSLRDLTG